MKIWIWILNFGFELGLGRRVELADYYAPVGWSEVLLETRRDNTESNLGNLITGIHKRRSLSIFVQIPWWSSTSGMTSTSGSSTTVA